MRNPRVAFFADSFHETNGVALTCREFVNFARRRDRPLFSVHAGQEDREFTEGSITTLELRTSRLKLGLEHDLDFDLMFFRRRPQLRRALEQFSPDVVHITGPSHCGFLGALAAHDLRVPLVASWHTNLHEFAARRLDRTLRWLPSPFRRRLTRCAERKSLDYALIFYRLAKLLFAPNRELMDLLHQRTGRPARLMLRGVDAAAFSPAHRNRFDGALTLGYVGRLSPEKSVRLLADVERGLESAGIRDYQFVIVGEGSERTWLERNLRRARFTGILRGADLARAYADMDVFLFPSTTDTFGNVVLEAQASGVPAVVRSEGGPKFVLQPGISGFVTTSPTGFAGCAIELCLDTELRRRMGIAARQHACARTWDDVFEEVWTHYSSGVIHGTKSESIRLLLHDPNSYTRSLPLAAGLRADAGPPTPAAHRSRSQGLHVPEYE